MKQSLQAMLHAQLEKAPERPALAIISPEGEVAWRTWAQFYNRAMGHATWLADQGLGRGDICTLVLPSEEFSATMLMATLLLGAIPLLIAPPFLRGMYSNLMQVLTHTIGKTKARLVICPDWLAEKREALEKGRRRTRFLFSENNVEPSPTRTLPMIAPAEDDVAAMQLTSGTTGFPRVCVWKQKNVLAALAGMTSAMKLSQDDVCLNWTPLYHDMGLVNNFFLCLTRGVPLVMLNPQDFIKRPVLWLRGLWETGATITWSPNFGFALAAQRVTDAEMEGIHLDGVRGFWNAAERIHLDTLHAFHERFAPFGVRFEALKTNYGCAENIGGATFSDPDGMLIVEHVDRSFLQKRRIAQPVKESNDGTQAISVVGVGRPVPGMQVKILSRTGRPLPEGHVGEIALRTSSRMAGFLGQSRETERALYGGLLRTGDLGYVRGQELFWVGRLRERITVRGKKLDPSEFEALLFQIPGLRPGCFAAFGVDDKALGTQRIVVAAEVREPTSRNLGDLSNDIRDKVFLHLGVEVGEVVLVQSGTLTKTSSGKRRHRHFRELYLNGRLKPYILDGGVK